MVGERSLDRCAVGRIEMDTDASTAVGRIEGSIEGSIEERIAARTAAGRIHVASNRKSDMRRFDPCGYQLRGLQLRLSIRRQECLPQLLHDRLCKLWRLLQIGIHFRRG